MQIATSIDNPVVIQPMQASEPGQVVPASEGESADPPCVTETSSQSVSRLARLAASLKISELSVQTTATRFRQNASGGAVLRAESRLDVHTRHEVYRFELDINAEALGFSSEQMRAMGGKTMQIELTTRQDALSIRRTVQSSVQKTLRQPAEVIGDLAKALGEVMSKPGNKAVLYELDEEARQAIMGDAKVTKLLGELVLIMSAINLQRDAGEPATTYLIRVSGKGAPSVQYQENVAVNQESRIVQNIIRIHPPESGDILDEQEEMLGEQEEMLGEQEEILDIPSVEG